MPRSSARPSPSLKLTHYGSLWKPVCAGGSTRTSGVTNERMRYLLADDCDAWLRERAIEPSPYSHVLAPGVYHLRLGNITDDQLPSSVLNALLDPQDSGVILQVTDWSRTQESLPTALSELASFTREADTFERRGILFSAEERPALEASLAAVIAGAIARTFMYRGLAHRCTSGRASSWKAGSTWPPTSNELRGLQCPNLPRSSPAVTPDPSLERIASGRTPGIHA